MNYEIEILEEAVEELEIEVLRYENLVKGLGLRFLQEWDNLLNIILKSPLGFQIQENGFRFVFFRKFPFLIVYEVIGNSIVVYRLISVKKLPVKRIPEKK